MITPREARRRLGSRSRRRANTNGKCIFGKVTKNNRAVKRRNPRPEKRVCVQVARLLAKENA